MTVTSPKQNSISFMKGGILLWCGG